MAAMFRATRLSRPPAASSQCPLETREGQRREPRGRVRSLLPHPGANPARNGETAGTAAGREGRDNGKSPESSAEFGF